MKGILTSSRGISSSPNDVSEILDPTFTPLPSPEEKELFEAKQVFRYIVFNETLLTHMGRSKVRKYLKTADAQAVWKEYSVYMTTASKGASEKRKLTQYVTNTVLDSQLRGTSQQFPLCLMLLLLKTVCGIELLSFNKILR